MCLLINCSAFERNIEMKVYSIRQRQVKLFTTMYKNNSGLIATIKTSKYNKSLCLTEKLVYENPLLFLY